MYIMENNQQQEFNRSSQMKNHNMTIKPLMQPKIAAIENDLIKIGMQIQESNILAQKYEDNGEFNQEQ